MMQNKKKSEDCIQHQNVHKPSTKSHREKTSAKSAAQYYTQVQHILRPRHPSAVPSAYTGKKHIKLLFKNLTYDLDCSYMEQFTVWSKDSKQKIHMLHLEATNLP